MCSKTKKYEIHEDLNEFEEKYRARIDEFIKDDPETRVVFLNADFGWGKTTFVENNLKIPQNNIYSPWLNKSEDYLEDIYYQTHKKDKGKTSSRALFLTLLLTIITILSDSIISILIEIMTSNDSVCSIKNFSLICSTNDNLKTLLFYLVIVIVAILFIAWFLIFLKPVPLIKFIKKDNGKYYEAKLIKGILNKVEKVLVIEDIDRTDDIEEILIVANKISEYIKIHKIDKYVLITGDYIRTIRRIGEPKYYDNNYLDLSTYRDKGSFVIEKVVSLRIDFSTIHQRIKNLLKENNLSANLTVIEYDEIVEFIKNKYLSIRFFVRFLKKYKKEISNGESLYHLLLKYFQEEKYFNIDEKVVKNSIYNLERFPVCINDIEMMYQKGTIKINGKKYKNIELSTIDDGNYSIINSSIKELFEENNQEIKKIFKEFYLSNRFPVLESDRRNSNNYNRQIGIGNTLKPSNLKQDLDNYLMGYDNNETDMHEGRLINKRCYFSSKNSSYNFENYKLTQTEEIVAQNVTNTHFIFAYIACFFRENKNEINRNYPKITEKINEIINNGS